MPAASSSIRLYEWSRQDHWLKEFVPGSEQAFLPRVIINYLIYGDKIELGSCLANLAANFQVPMRPVASPTIAATP